MMSDLERDLLLALAESEVVRIVQSFGNYEETERRLDALQARITAVWREVEENKKSQGK